MRFCLRLWDEFLDYHIHHGAGGEAQHVGQQGSNEFRQEDGQDRADGLKLSAAGIRPVAGVDVHVQRPQAKRTMIAGGIAQGLYFLSAIGADESAVVLRKSFRFHFVCPL